jgi:hypothetical protein
VRRLFTSTISPRSSDCHACFVHLCEGAKLVLRSASQIYGHMIGRMEIDLDDSLAGWVARHGRAPSGSGPDA